MVLEPIHALLLVSLLALPGDPGSRGAEEITVFVTRTEGGASAERAGGAVVVLRYGSILTADWRLAVPSAASIELLCSNDQLVRIDGPRRNEPLAIACSRGEWVAPGTFAMMAREPWELRRDVASARETDVVTFRMRGWEEDLEKVATLLDPRETAVFEARPVIRWTRVPDAWGYWIELSGAETWRVFIPADEVRCTSSDLLPIEAEVCSADWPPEAPDLPLGGVLRLRIEASRSRPGGTPAPRDHRLWRLSPTVRQSIDRSLEVLRAADLPVRDRALREALLLSRFDLLTRATDRLRELLREHPDDTEAWLLLASLEVRRELPRLALRILGLARSRATDDRALLHEIVEAERDARALLGAVDPPPSR